MNSLPFADLFLLISIVFIVTFIVKKILYIRKKLHSQSDELNYIKLSKVNDNIPIIPVLVMAYNRPTVNRCLNSIFKYRKEYLHNFPIIVSQDGTSDQLTTEVISGFRNADKLLHLIHPHSQESFIPAISKELKHFEGHFRIARHYKWALTQVFDILKFRQVIVLEDDMEIAPDFFNYFMAMLPVLRSDPTLFCISSWNDNGKRGLVDPQNPALFYRSDFFPGLGWMLTSEVWTKWREIWPRAFWDDWVRLPKIRNGRACIRPEISRTYNFGKIGVSNGENYDEHLKDMVINNIGNIDYPSLDLVNVLNKTEYDQEWIRKVYEDATPVSHVNAIDQSIDDEATPIRAYRITYHNEDEFKTLAKRFHLMADIRGGVPRTAYLGIITFKYKNRTIYVAPERPQRPPAKPEG